jgi:uncharacterized protein YbjT (DUF2867 family)
MIVITAPTSTIGRQVLANVLDKGESIRVIARDPSHLSPQTRQRVEVVQGSHSDLGVVTKAFTGADAVFWLVPPASDAKSVEAAYVDFARPACTAFKSQGVKRVVGVSALGRGTPVAKNAGFVTASLAMDDLIASTGVSYRALTMPSFMDSRALRCPCLRRSLRSKPNSWSLERPLVRSAALRVARRRAS